MRVGRSYKQYSIEGDFDAIVIGSGMGGLTAAALLAIHRGQRVLVLERHYTAGGYTHAFRRPGYEWDVGVHYIGAGVSRPGSEGRRLFDHLTDGQLEWADMGPVYDRIIIGDQHYDYRAGREAFREQMHSYFPLQRKAIDSYLDLLKSVTRRAMGFFVDKALPRSVGAVLGPLLRLPAAGALKQSTLAVLSRLTDDRRLIAVLTGQYGDYGLPPNQSSFLMHATLAAHYLKGAAYPVGGATRIAATIVPLIERAGGAVVTNAEVDKILVKRRRAIGVQLADGRELHASTVISSAGVANTITQLLPSDEAGRSGLLKRLQPLGPSVAHASLYVGLSRSDAELGLGKTNLWVYEDDDHDAAFARAMKQPQDALPLAFISFPSAKDPDFQRRYPGHATVEVVTFVPMRSFEAWRDTKWKKRGADYEAFKEVLSQRLLDTLLNQVPQIRDKIDVVELSTPLSTQHFAGHASGEIYGLEHTVGRFRAKWLRATSPIRGLYFSGVDIATCGVMGAAMGGVLCASAILRSNLMAKIDRPASG